MVKQTIMALDGAQAVAEAMRQINPDVVAAYPITPQTEIVQKFSQFVADGKVDTEFVPVESEHAAMSACVGAAAAGGRAMTATASAGMALMWEVLYVASGSRLPIVLNLVSRALSAPINIHCDHSDFYGARDAGWVQLFGEGAQEAYDNAIQSVRIAEALLLPVMHSQDGFIVSHGVERLDILPDDAVQSFIGTFMLPNALLKIDQPLTMGPLDLQDYYFEHKRQQAEAMSEAPDVICQVGREFGELTGRSYGMTESYKLDDAEIALVALGSTCGTARGVVDAWRKKGVKVGLLKYRTFRPFPAQQTVDALAGRTAIAVLDRALSFGAQGNPLFLEVCTALFQAGSQAKVIDYVYGLGGRDTTPDQIDQAVQGALDVAETGETGELVRYIGLRD
jgi:pyruvate ferredoxin oxidoreductase alpha subunit